MAMFNKRHYEALARVVQEARFHAIIKTTEFTAQDAINAVIVEMAGAFARDNSLFKRDRFERACQPGANVRART